MGSTLAVIVTLGVPAAGSLLMGFITTFLGGSKDSVNGR